MFDGAVSIWTMLYFTVLGFTIMVLLIDSRLTRTQTVLTVSGLLALMLSVEVVIWRTLGFTMLIRLFTPAIHIPSLAVFVAISRRRNWQMVFQLLSALLFCFLIHQGASLCFTLSGGKRWAMVAAYGVLTVLVLLFLAQYLRPMVLRVFREIHRGWWLMCLVLAGYYAINIYLIPELAGESMRATVLKAAISLLIVGAYAVFLYLLNTMYREMEVRHSMAVAALQLAGLRQRLAALQDAEERIRMERHDLRHRLQMAGEMARRNSRDALAFLDDARHRLDEVQPVRWCQPPVLDAVFSTYFRQAEGRGICVKAEIALPQQLPVDEGELAIVFANALENAINACAGLPDAVIRCKVICHPGIMFEISNPYAGTVRLDSRGLPLSDRKGHGVGTQSIAAFCSRCGARYCYEVSEEAVTLRVVL